MFAWVILLFCFPLFALFCLLLELVFGNFPKQTPISIFYIQHFVEKALLFKVIMYGLNIFFYMY